MPFLNETQMRDMGFAHLGKGVRISALSSIHGAANISIGDHARIDDFALITAAQPVELGAYVHIAAYSALFGSQGILMEDFSGISSRVSLYSASDDFSGAAMAHPTVPEEFRNVRKGRIVLRRHGLIGSGSIVLPGVEIGTGASVGALSLVNRSLEAWGIFAGIPCAFIKARDRGLLDMEARFLESGRRK
jgi:acetyltransferase-like isoleucine patch superfamily enzyme